MPSYGVGGGVWGGGVLWYCVLCLLFGWVLFFLGCVFFFFFFFFCVPFLWGVVGGGGGVGGGEFLVGGFFFGGLGGLFFLCFFGGLVGGVFLGVSFFVSVLFRTSVWRGQRRYVVFTPHGPLHLDVSSSEA